MHSDAAAVNFQLNSHLSTLANIHKIYHTLNRLNLTEDVGQDDHQTGFWLVVAYSAAIWRLYLANASFKCQKNSEN
uniref:Uncharacterized protein n=1 Tax=Pavo cristatus TaxID=9049 RepID=A0A8C9LA54_PAVCR